MPRNKKRQAVEELQRLKKKFAKLERTICDNSSSSEDSEESSQYTSSSGEEKGGQRESQPAVITPILEVETAPSENIIELLGKNPEEGNRKGPALHEEIVVRWTNYLKQGISVETRKDLVTKYPLPENCPGLLAPKMNEEIKSILTTQVGKNDTFFSTLQGQLGAALASMGSILTEQLNTAQASVTNESMISKLSDAAQLILSVHHALSVKRKWEVTPLINEEGRSAARQSSIDEYLFGAGFIEKVSSTKTLKKASANLKNTTKRKYSSNPGTSGTKNLNFKRLTFKTRMKGGNREKREWEDTRSQKRGTLGRSSPRYRRSATLQQYK